MVFPVLLALLFHPRGLKVVQFDESLLLVLPASLAAFRPPLLPAERGPYRRENHLRQTLVLRVAHARVFAPVAQLPPRGAAEGVAGVLPDVLVRLFKVVRFRLLFTVLSWRLSVLLRMALALPQGVLAVIQE